jgi:large subunit ribosomal protein L30
MNIAVIQIRGTINSKTEIKNTLKFLNLERKHACTVVPDTPNYLGMLNKVKDYVAFGEISDETNKKLIEKRGMKNKEGKLKPFFRLHPPKGGFERKGIKKTFKEGGVLGNRGKEMSKLVEKML